MRSDEEKNTKQKIGSNEGSFNTLKRVECLLFSKQCLLSAIAMFALSLTARSNGSTLAGVCVSVDFKYHIRSTVRLEKQIW